MGHRDGEENVLEAAANAYRAWASSAVPDEIKPILCEAAKRIQDTATVRLPWPALGKKAADTRLGRQLLDSRGGNRSLRSQPGSRLIATFWRDPGHGVLDRVLR